MDIKKENIIKSIVLVKDFVEWKLKEMVTKRWLRSKQHGFRVSNVSPHFEYYPSFSILTIVRVIGTVANIAID